MIWFIQYKKHKLSNLTQIDAKTIVMNLISNLSLIQVQEMKKNYKYKSQ